MWIPTTRATFAAMSFEIRRAEASDLDAVVSLLQQLSLDGESREDAGRLGGYLAAFAAINADPRQSLLVAVDGGRVVGTAAVIVVSNVSHGGRPYAIVEDVVVDESSRGRGCGVELMQRVIEIAREAGCYKVGLTSNRSRTDAHGFYERLGFRATHVGFRMEL